LTPKREFEQAVKPDVDAVTLGHIIKAMLAQLLDGDALGGAAGAVDAEHPEAGYRELLPRRHGQSNANYTRDLLASVGKSERLLVPRDRQGEFRTTGDVEEAILEMCLSGSSVRKIAGVTDALKKVRISKNVVSRVTSRLEEQQKAWRKRSLKVRGYPYLYLDTACLKVRWGKSVTDLALLACVGVDEEGLREVLTVEVAKSGEGAAYASLLRGLIGRGVKGVRLVISDDEDIKAAVAAELPGADWQRCVVHFERNVLSHVPASSTAEVAEDLKVIFKVRRQKTARTLAEEFVELHRKRFPKAVSVFEAGIEDALSYLSFPRSHHARICSTNMLQRLFKEVKRETKMVGVFPNETSAQTLATEIVLRSSEEWALKRYLVMDGLEAAGNRTPHNIRDIDLLEHATSLGLPDGFNSERNPDILIPAPLDGSTVGTDGFRGAVEQTVHREVPAPVHDQPCLRAHFFGHFEVFCDGETVTLGCSNKALSILKYLLAHPTSPVSQDHLMGWLWPESNLRKARWSLNSAIRTLRKLLSSCPPLARANHVLLEEGCYRLSPIIRVETDVDEFDALYEQGCRLEKESRMAEVAAEYQKAVELYRGDYLGEDLYEDWTMLERARLVNTYMDLLCRLAVHYMGVGQHQESIRACYKVLEKDRCHEDSYRLLMQCYARLGLRARALQQYRLCEKILKQEYGTDPSPETQALCRDLTRVRA
jgi:transposase-like protein/DNA-binding SARP family transcriptional activator